MGVPFMGVGWLAMTSRPRATYTEPMSLAPRMKRPIPSSIEAEQRVQTLTVVADLQAPNLYQNP